MDCYGWLKVGTVVDVLPAVAKVRRDGLLARPSSSQTFGFSRPLYFKRVFRFCESNNFSNHRLPSLFTLARVESNESDYRSLGTPLELYTPEGKFLCDILKNQPHIFQAAVQKQLEELAFDRESAFARWEISQGSSESSLHGRIAKMKEIECQRAAEEVMYMLIVHSFYKINVPMVPNLSKCISNGRIDIWSSKDQELGSIHGIELLDMVREHLSNILRLQGKSDSTGNWTTLKIERLQLGRLYAASIMYGYFLKSVNLRHSLELSLSSNNEDHLWDQKMHVSRPHFWKQGRENAATLGCFADKAASLYAAAQGSKADKLRGYMMGFNSATLKLCSKLRSFEAANLIENHSWALFGNPETSSLDKDEVVTLLVSGLKRLILEAVAFGTFLWDVEWYVDSKCRLKDN
ncbi:UV-B-induced protein At3g17800, chloroplastic-like [Phalaenopsis equestris]|uniref:UV-B-induced protein At3g17800, chloroplastic-like n=1 Tax=Phalaenopsis equestris TaxID=78828 RepID=UPI0009E22DD0|nr:UV-B-induced protein At3g17800, chloroplastic-like [Phalaenopsis equestris]